ncbi:MAG: SEC-C metal-binding domain-containing protein, partial [Chloroflexota bacterium]
AVTESEEFGKIYNLDVAVIPTHRPIARMDQQDYVYVTEDAKFRAVVNEIQERQQKGQPVLVGTASIDTSQRLAQYLDRAKIKHEVLNAKQHEREATIIAQAGRPGSVTIATNMAGRGVDILLGGNPEGIAREKFRKEGLEVTDVPVEEWEAAVEEAKVFTKAEREKVLALGGLYVLGTERHEARRIDNQLRGRSGRQGDPGESRFFVSLEDDIMKRFGGDRVKNMMNWANLEEDVPIESGVITGTISQAQIRMEGHNFDIRKKVLEYDDVVNKQREVIYKQRRDWMELNDEERRETYRRILQEMVQAVLDDYLDEEIPEDELDFEGLYRQLLVIFPVPEDITPDTLREMEENEEDVDTVILTALDAAYDQKTEVMTEEVMKQAERHVMLWAVDNLWQRHLTDLDILREGIGLEGLRQRNPVVEYKLQGFEMWQKLQNTIRDRAGRDIFRVRVNMPKPEPKKNLKMIHGNSAEKAEPQTVRKSAKKKIGRNDPCWCGSGKKYKHCHYKEDRQAEMA